MSVMSNSNTLHPACTSLQQRRTSDHRKKLRLPSQPLKVPVPPSLLYSPYLNSPESIFQRAVSAPRLPSEEDEQWLQDTVPLTPNARDERRRASGVLTMSPFPRHEMRDEPQQRGRSTRQKALVHVPPSPPLVRWSHSVASAATHSPVWPGQTKTRSEPNVARLVNKGFFVNNP